MTATATLQRHTSRGPLLTETFFDRYGQLWTVTEDTWAGFVTCENVEGWTMRFPRAVVLHIVTERDGHAGQSVRVPVATIKH